jgi:C-terminal processing protease CtpA/Prc
VQQPFSMDDGSLLKLTVAKWFTPQGKNIELD